MTAPFKTPVEWTGHHNEVLIDADCELICNTDAATFLEREYIARAVNKHALLLELLSAAQEYVPRGYLLHERISAALE